MFQNNHKRIDPLKIQFSYFNKSMDDFSKLDFKQKDGSDPLKIDQFIHNNPSYYDENHIVRIYSVRYEDKLTAFFTLSMCQIEFEYAFSNGNNNDNDYAKSKTSKTKFVFYPALLIRQLGIEKGFKGQGLGYHIILYCLGLGQVLSQKVGCTLLILRTTKKLAEKYYGPRYNFKWEKEIDKETVWAYRKLF